MSIATSPLACVPTCQPGEVGLARLLVQRLARSAADAAEVAEPSVGLGEQRGALGDRAVGEQLDRANAHPFIAEAGVHTGGDHLVELAIVDVRIEAAHELAGIARILIALQNRRIAVGLAGRGDAAARELFRDQRRALAVVLA